MSAAALSVVETAHGSLIGEKPPLVTPGTYELMFVHYETIVLANGKAPKLVLWFRITTHGDFIGTKLARYYNVIKLEGKARRNGGFKVGWCSAFMREYATIFNSVPGRTNRIPMSCFDGTEVRGMVKTVVSTWDQQNLPRPLHYSVIERLLPPTPAVTPTPRSAPAPTPTLKHQGEE